MSKNKQSAVVLPSPTQGQDVQERKGASMSNDTQVQALVEAVGSEVARHQEITQRAYALAIATAVTLERDLNGQALVDFIAQTRLCCLKGEVSLNTVRKVMGIDIVPGESKLMAPAGALVRANFGRNIENGDPDLWIAELFEEESESEDILKVVKGRCLCNALEWLAARAREQGASGTTIEECKHVTALRLMELPLEARFLGFDDFLPVNLTYEYHKAFWFAFGSEYMSLMRGVLLNSGCAWDKQQKKVVATKDVMALPQSAEYQQGDRLSVTWEDGKPAICWLKPGIQLMPKVVDGQLIFAEVGACTRRVQVQTADLVTRLRSGGGHGIVNAAANHAARYGALPNGFEAAHPELLDAVRGVLDNLNAGQAN